MTVERDYIDYIRKCHKCQVYGDKIKAPPILLFYTVSPWLFIMWRIDVIRSIHPQSNNGYKFILVVMITLLSGSKLVRMHMWLKRLSKNLSRELICSYRLHERIVMDNTQNFNGKKIIELCAKWKIKHLISSLYKPKMNGVIETANKNIKKII